MKCEKPKKIQYIYIYIYPECPNFIVSEGSNFSRFTHPNTFCIHVHIKMYKIFNGITYTGLGVMFLIYKHSIFNGSGPNPFV